MKKEHQESNTIIPSDTQRPLTHLFIRNTILDLTKDIELTPDFSDLAFMEAIAEVVRRELRG